MEKTKETATDILVRAMEKIQDAPDVKVVILIENFGPDENMVALNSNADITQILGMLTYALVVEKDIVRNARG